MFPATSGYSKYFPPHSYPHMRGQRGICLENITGVMLRDGGEPLNAHAHMSYCSVRYRRASRLNRRPAIQNSHEQEEEQARF